MEIIVRTFRGRRNLPQKAPAAMWRKVLSTLMSPFVIGVGARMVVQAVAFAQIMIVARFVDISGFGTYTLGWATCVIFVSLVYTGFYQALLLSPDFEADRHTGFWSMAIIGAGGSVVMAALGLLLPGHDTVMAAVFLALAPMPVLRAIIAWNELHLVRDQRVRLVSLYGMASESTALLVTWLSLREGHGLFALVYGRYAALAVDFAATVLGSRSYPALRFAWAAFGRMRQTALPLWGTSAMAMSANYGADLILGGLMNTAAVGAYRGGARISQTAADLIFQPMNTIIWSSMTRAEKAGRRDDLGRIWLEAMGFGAAMLWPILVAFAVLSKDLVVFLFDASWGPVAPVIVILCFSRAIGFLSVLLEPTMVCQGKGTTQMWIRGTALVTFLLALAAFGRFGAAEAAGAHVVMSVLSSSLSITVIFSSLRISAEAATRAFLPAIVISGLCYAGLALSAGLRAEMGPTPGLLAAVAGLVVIWVATVGWCMKRGIVTLPRP